MGALKRDEVSRFIQSSGSKDKKALEGALVGLESLSVNKGLNEGEIEELVAVLTGNKLASSTAVKLLHYLIPEEFISKKALENLLSWYFTEIAKNRISKLLQKHFLHWITGVVHFELGDVSVIDSYFHSFLFMLRKAHLEAVVSKLLCLLLKPEDAKRWTVKKILEIRQKSGPKPHINSLLSILKSFRADVVPETVPMTRINYENSSFHENFRKAYERKIQTVTYNPASSVEIKWNQIKCYDKKSAHLPRLIPTAEEVNFGSSVWHTKKNVSVIDVTNMTSLGTNCLRIGIPAQTLALLANVAGFHVLAFSDSITKSRFSHKLYHTLFRVFILELEPYSTEEKTVFLESLVGLQDYIQQGIPAVSEFLFHFLLIWDGEEFRSQILNLIQWVVVKNEKDWNECFLRPLRQVFRSSGQHCKCLIIEGMGSLLRNNIAFYGAKEGLFFDSSPALDTVFIIQEIVTFTKELIVEGILWNKEAGRREILTLALDFYEICSVIEYSVDFPVFLLMPPALVYGCLFSGSRVIIARLCSLLTRFWEKTVSKLLSIGNPEDHKVEIQEFEIYMLDYYRCLWSDVNFQHAKGSFIFNHKAFSYLLFNFKNSLGVNIESILDVEKNFSFWYQNNNDRQNYSDKLAVEYPSVLSLKHICEDQIL